MDSLLTVRQTAELLGLHPKTIYNWAASGRLPCIHVGSRIRFSPRDIDRWLLARKEG